MWNADATTEEFIAKGEAPLNLQPLCAVRFFLKRVEYGYKHRLNYYWDRCFIAGCHQWDLSVWEQMSGPDSNGYSQILEALQYDWCN